MKKEIHYIMNKQEHLIKQAFRHLNAYKRFRALEQNEREKGNHESADRLELNKYRATDQLELTLRGLQTEIRKTEGDSGDDEA